MSALIVAAESFSGRYGNDIKAALILLGTAVLAYVVDRTLKGRARRVVASVSGGELSPDVDTASRSRSRSSPSSTASRARASPRARSRRR